MRYQSRVDTNGNGKRERSRSTDTAAATGASAFYDRVLVQGHGLQFLFSEVPEFVGNGITSSKCRRPINDCLPPEAITDCVNSSVGHPARPPQFAAGATSLIFKRERQLQLHDGMF